MQIINFNFNVNFDFLYDIKKIYEFYSDVNYDNERNTLFDLKEEISKELIPFIDIVEKGFNQKFEKFNFVDRNFNYQINKNNKKAILCFSGGKDSVCAALKLMKDYDLTLYYLDGITKSYKDEIERAKECAKELGLELIVQSVSLKGKTNFLESPVKNMVIYASALNYGLPLGITNYFFGNAKEDTTENSNFDRDYSDSLELFDTYTKSISNEINVEIYNIPVINNYIDSIKFLANYKNLWNKIQSCLSPYRYRKNLKTHNEKKYNIKLNAYSCGSCWKCCVEYIIWCDMNVIEYNENFYNHCLEFLMKKAKTELQGYAKPKNYKELYLSFIKDEKLYNESYLKNKNKNNIRKANLEDYKSIVKLYNKNSKSLGRYFKSDIIEKINNEIFYLYVENDEVIGFCSYDLKKRKKYIEITYLCVNENYRNRHIATKLIKQIQKDTYELKMDYYAECLEGLENNNFYDKIGIISEIKEKNNYNLRLYKLNLL